MSAQRMRSFLEDIADEDETGVWLVTYSDLMTLILVFFILLYTIFFIETERFKDAIATVQVEDQQFRTDLIGAEQYVVEFAAPDDVPHAAVGVSSAGAPGLLLAIYWQTRLKPSDLVVKLLSVCNLFSYSPISV